MEPISCIQFIVEFYLWSRFRLKGRTKNQHLILCFLRCRDTCCYLVSFIAVCVCDVRNTLARDSGHMRRLAALTKPSALGYQLKGAAVLQRQY